MSRPNSNRTNVASPRWVLPLAVAFALGTASIPARAETITVTIENLVFSPTDIEARVGDTVLWVNEEIGEPGSEEGRPVRLFLPLPSQHEGPHHGLAVMWFAFGPAVPIGPIA